MYFEMLSYQSNKEGTMNCIKEILRVQGRSQVWLADELKKSYVVVTNYCNNKTQPSIPTLYRIAKLLDVDVRDLILPSPEATEAN